MNTDTYKKDPLRYVLNLAYRQAMDPDKKGMQRHGDEKPFREQISSAITRTVGLGYPLGQALKKHEEHKRLSIRTMAVNELLGAINYLAIAIIHLIDEGKE